MVWGKILFYLILFLYVPIFAMEDRDDFLSNLPVELIQLILENINYYKDPFVSIETLISFSRTNKINRIVTQSILNKLIKNITNKDNILKIIPNLSTPSLLPAIDIYEIMKKEHSKFEKEFTLLENLANYNFKEVGDIVNYLCKLFFEILQSTRKSLKPDVDIFPQMLNCLIKRYEVLLYERLNNLEKYVQISRGSNSFAKKTNQLEFMIGDLESVINQLIRFKCWIDRFCYCGSFSQDFLKFNYRERLKSQNAITLGINKEFSDAETLFNFSLYVAFDSGFCDGYKLFSSLDDQLAHELNKYLSDKQWYINTNQYLS